MTSGFTLLQVAAGLRAYSESEHEWGLGEKNHHATDHNVGAVDWSVEGYARWFDKTFEANRAYILHYLETSPGEIKVENGKVKITRAQFEDLMRTDHSNYQPETKSRNTSGLTELVLAAA